MQWMGVTRYLAASACLLMTWPASGEALAHTESAALEPSPRLHASTGRDLRQYAPDRMADLQHMRLEISFPTLDELRFEAVERLTFIPLHRPLEQWSLDAVGMDIRGVTLDGRPVSYAVDDEHVILRFDPPIDRDREYELVFRYFVSDPVDGIYRNAPDPEGAPRGGTTQIWTQGQIDGARHWFISHDEPDERLTTELIVDVPAGNAVISNGALIDEQLRGDRAVYHWRTEKPHAPYLVTLVIGDFETVEDSWFGLPVRYHVPRGHADDARRTFARTGRMIGVFEAFTDEKYPWEKYDQVVVRNFGARGMENTSVATYYETCLLDERALLDGDMDGLVAHELAHQWFGDYITCKSWDQIWLNEGFASYLTTIWFEERDGREAYEAEIVETYESARSRDSVESAHAMTSNVWERPGQVFGRAANPYSKGSAVLHMIRMMLGDEAFRQGLAEYVNRHALDVVETADLRQAFEDVSGRNLRPLFDQYVDGYGIPELDVTLSWDEPTRELLVSVEQTQTISDRTPAFRFVLPIVAVMGDESREFRLEVSERRLTRRFTLNGRPDMVMIDPHLSVLHKPTYDKPLDWWLAQLANGTTIGARYQAASSLVEFETPRVINELVALARDARAVLLLRTRAVETLGAMQAGAANEALVMLAETGVADATVRRAIVRALVGLDHDRVVPILANHAADDESYRVTAEAIRGLAAHGADQHLDMILAAVRRDSQHGVIRQAALQALAELDAAVGLPTAMVYARIGYSDNRTRAVAVETVARLGHHEPDAAFDVLVSLTDDPEWRTEIAAMEGLAILGDERGIDVLESLESHPNPYLARTAREQRARLESELATRDLTPDQMRERIRDLEAELRELKQSTAGYDG
jgi:aminopeptidase N